MNTSTANRRSPLGLFPGAPTPRLYDRVVDRMRQDLSTESRGIMRAVASA